MSGRVILLQGDAAHLPLRDGTVDAVVCDPPYGLEFMGREWDTFKTGDGFRRSRNPADAGRDNVFGRASRTGPEYSTGAGKRGKPGIGGRPTDWVSNQGWNQFRCRNCGHLSNGGGPCTCANPDFARVDHPWNAFQGWCGAWAAECLRVLRPGGWLLAFGGSRTAHRLKCGIEDAGFEIRDTVAGLTGRDAPEMMWVYGQGMPKSRDAARAVDMAVCSLPGRHCMRRLPDNPKPGDHVCPDSEEGKRWKGWGTALAPAWEPIVVARKPLAGTLGANLLACGTGAVNVDGCRARTSDDLGRTRTTALGIMNDDGWLPRRQSSDGHEAGRWPSNVVLAHSASCLHTGTRRVHGDAAQGGAGHLDGGLPSAGAGTGSAAPGGPRREDMRGCADDCPLAELERQSSNASRYFPVFRYQAKAPGAERPRLPDGTGWPTVKPLELIRWLVRLVTPPGGTVLDLFAGTGPVGEACIIEDFDAVLVDKDPQAIALAQTRLAKPVMDMTPGHGGSPAGTAPESPRPVQRRGERHELRGVPAADQAIRHELRPDRTSAESPVALTPVAGKPMNGWTGDSDGR